MKRFPKAFTMLEVLLAVTIFVLVVTGLYTAFRVGVRSYELSDQAVDSAQQARIVFDTLTRDLRSVYYAQETTYNTTVRSYRAKFDTERQVAEREGTLDAFYERMLLLSEKEGRNPYDYGIAIDLSFNAEDHERTDSLSFVREQLADPSLQTEPWALERIAYDVEDGELVRATDSVFSAPIDLEGNEVEKPQPEKHVLAKRIKTFDLAWGYFYEGEWYEAPDWAADERRYRNPVEELDEEDPEYEQLRREQEAKPADGIPSYLLVTLGIADKKRPEKIKTFQTLIRIPSAQENNIPLTDEERQRLEETGVQERIPRGESSETARLEK